ncbi:unnamed protein product [Amoebophrya sp. A120]|nr:unnamed protein product [Amoebophrya sp. A120]|eukprot:GSA120T00017518001.1
MARKNRSFTRHLFLLSQARLNEAVHVPPVSEENVEGLSTADGPAGLSSGGSEGRTPAAKGFLARRDRPAGSIFQAAFLRAKEPVSEVTEPVAVAVTPGGEQLGEDGATDDERSSPAVDSLTTLPLRVEGGTSEEVESGFTETEVLTSSVTLGALQNLDLLQQPPALQKVNQLALLEPEKGQQKQMQPPSQMQALQKPMRKGQVSPRPPATRPHVFFWKHTPQYELSLWSSETGFAGSTRHAIFEPIKAFSILSLSRQTSRHLSILPGEMKNWELDPETARLAGKVRTENDPSWTRDDRRLRFSVAALLTVASFMSGGAALALPVLAAAKASFEATLLFWPYANEGIWRTTLVEDTRAANQGSVQVRGALEPLYKTFNPLHLKSLQLSWIIYMRYCPHFEQVKKTDKLTPEEQVTESVFDVMMVRNIERLSKKKEFPLAKEGPTEANPLGRNPLFPCYKVTKAFWSSNDEYSVRRITGLKEEKAHTLAEELRGQTLETEVKSLFTMWKDTYAKVDLLKIEEKASFVLKAWSLEAPAAGAQALIAGRKPIDHGEGGATTASFLKNPLAAVRSYVTGAKLYYVPSQKTKKVAKLDDESLVSSIVEAAPGDLDSSFFQIYPTASGLFRPTAHNSAFAQMGMPAVEAMKHAEDLTFLLRAIQMRVAKMKFALGQRSGLKKHEESSG